jgi:hypothetical protein
VSHTNRPRFDQISDATKYVQHPISLSPVDARADTQGRTDGNIPYVQDSTTPDVIEEEDCPSSHARQESLKVHQQQAPKLHITPSFKETDQHMYHRHANDSDDAHGQAFQQFNVQEADFESKSDSETASEGHQPSIYRRSELAFSQSQSPPPNKSIAPSHPNPFSAKHSGQATKIKTREQANGGTGASVHVRAHEAMHDTTGAVRHNSQSASSDDESLFSDKQLEELYDRQYEQQQLRK